MIVGIMADTHDRLPLIDKAIKRLNEEKVVIVLHAGDYVSPFVVTHFKPLKAHLIGVFGNNEKRARVAERELLKKRFKTIGADLRGNFAEIKINELKIALLHGDEKELLRSLISTQNHKIIVHGHTHEAKTYRKGETLVINPGEVCGYLTGKSTITLLNTQTLNVKTVKIV